MASAFMKAMESRFEWLSLVRPGVTEDQYSEYCGKALASIAGNLKLCKTVLSVSDSVRVLTLIKNSPLVEKVKDELLSLVTGITDVDGFEKPAYDEDGTTKATTRSRAGCLRSTPS